jgi:hypothetical protein
LLIVISLPLPLQVRRRKLWLRRFKIEARTVLNAFCVGFERQTDFSALGQSVRVILGQFVVLVGARVHQVAVDVFAARLLVHV